MNKHTFKPGQTVPVSGQYGLVGPRGGVTKQEVTSIKGKIFPPTPKKNEVYKLVDETK